MKNEQLISIEQFCSLYRVDTSFLQSLSDFDFIELIPVENTLYVNKEHIKNLEKIMRLHYELDINLEGIEAISYLLQRMESMQDELTLLKNRLRLYESE